MEAIIMEILMKTSGTSKKKFLEPYLETFMEPSETSEKLKRFGGIVEENEIIDRILAEIDEQQDQNSKYIDEIISKG